MLCAGRTTCHLYGLHLGLLPECVLGPSFPLGRFHSNSSLPFLWEEMAGLTQRVTWLYLATVGLHLSVLDQLFSSEVTEVWPYQRSGQQVQN